MLSQAQGEAGRKPGLGARATLLPHDTGASDCPPAALPRGQRGPGRTSQILSLLCLNPWGSWHHWREAHAPGLGSPGSLLCSSLAVQPSPPSSIQPVSLLDPRPLHALSTPAPNLECLSLLFIRLCLPILDDGPELSLPPSLPSSPLLPSLPSPHPCTVCPSEPPSPPLDCAPRGRDSLGSSLHAPCHSLWAWHTSAQQMLSE